MKTTYRVKRIETIGSNRKLDKKWQYFENLRLEGYDCGFEFIRNYGSGEFRLIENRRGDARVAGKTIIEKRVKECKEGDRPCQGDWEQPKERQPKI